MLTKLSSTKLSSLSRIMKVACIQMTSRDNIEENINFAAGRIREAASAGADFILTPENTGIMAMRSEQSASRAQFESDHLVLNSLKEVAKEVQKWLLIGSVGVKLEDDPRITNRSYLITPAGEIAASYDKIHMFDVTLGTGETYTESRNCRPGVKAIVVDTPWGKLGMTICYDLRFPSLYRTLAQAGARILTVPAAFTRPTGEAHWKTLLQARAIENACYVIAPAQCGTHTETRKTYGHSLIIDPWGKVLAEAGEEPGIIYADLDMSEVDRIRQSLPSLQHDRPFELA